MKKCKVLSNVFEHGVAYGKKGDTVIVPDHIAKANSDKRKTSCALEILGEATEKDLAPAKVE